MYRGFERKAGLGYRLICLWTNSNIMLFKTVIPLRNLKHKTVLSLSNIVRMCCYVMLSNVVGF